jgi:hypothetical protein
LLVSKDGIGSCLSNRSGVHWPSIDCVAATYEKEEPVTGKSFKGKHRFTRIVVAFFALLPAAALRADGPAVINCPWYPPSNGDDFASRGFYSQGYPGTSLKQVVIPLSFPANGTYQLSLTASSGTFDGTILGTATVTITATSAAFQSVTFDFGTIPVTEGTGIAFAGAVPAKPSGVTGKVMMQFVTEPLCRLTETNGTDAPLSSFRRGGIAAVINGDVATTFNHVVTVAAAASVHGANGTFFHTDVEINNPLGAGVSVTATYHCFGGANCGTGPAQFNIDAGKAVTFTDIVQTLFGAPETGGAISFAYSSTSYVSTLKVVSRTYTPSLPNPTEGTFLEGRAAVDAVGATTFVGLGNNGADRSRGFRTNFGLYNPSAFPNTVTLTLAASDGTPIGSPVTQVWGPRQSLQINDIFGAAGAESTVTTDATAHVTATLPAFPYVSVTDNQSGDTNIQQ